MHSLLPNEISESVSGLRVLWLTENYYPNQGGMAQSCDRIVSTLRGLSVTIDLVHICRRELPPVIEEKRNGRNIIYPAGTDASHALNCIWNIISTPDESIFYTHVLAFGGMLPMLAGPVFAAWLDIPLITLLRGNDFDVGVFTPRRSEILREAITRSACVCVVTHEKGKKVTSLFPGAKTTWVPNGINLEDWEPLPIHIRMSNILRGTCISEGRRVLGIFGQIKQKKGGLFFLESLLESGHVDRFHLLFVGELEEAVTQWLSEHEAEVSYTRYPFMNRYDLLSYYLACDMVVVPSFYDGLPNVLLEAGALGIPLLASTAGGMGDILQDGSHGFLFRPGDRHDCARAINLAASAPDDVLKELGCRIREIIRFNFNLKIEAERYISVLVETNRAWVNARIGSDSNHI